jgi:hypothetical protein
MQAPEIVVATPDRLCELLTLSALDVSSVSYVVRWRLFQYVKFQLSLCFCILLWCEQPVACG